MRNLAPVFAALSLAAASAAAQDEAPTTVDLVLVVDDSGTMESFPRQTLDDFVDMLGEFQRLAVIRAGEDAELLRPLLPVAGAVEKKDVRSVLHDLQFMDDYADVHAGLAIAIEELARRSGEKSPKIVVLVSDGRIDKPAGWIKRDEFVRVLGEQVLTDYFLYRVTLTIVAWGAEADLPLLQAIAYAGAGRIMVAPNEAALGDAFTIIADGAEGMQPALLAAAPQEKPAEAGSTPATAALPAAFWVVMTLFGLLVLGAVGYAALLASRSRTVRPEPAAGDDERETPTLAQLRYKIEAIARQVRTAGTDLGGLQVDLVSYGAEHWEKERSFLERYHHLTEHLFLLMDHVELQLKGGAGREGSELLYKKASRILEEEGIEEIPVREGEKFDGKFHKHVGERPGETPAGTILEVARKGYVMKGDLLGEEEIVLRPAEVIVSSGPARTDVN
jgi:hypothetical protein